MKHFEKLFNLFIFKANISICKIYKNSKKNAKKPWPMHLFWLLFSKYVHHANLIKTWLLLLYNFKYFFMSYLFALNIKLFNAIWQCFGAPI